MSYVKFFLKRATYFANTPLVLILVFTALITYVNILPNQLFFDDEELIYKNIYIQDFSYWRKYFTENMIAGAGKTSNMYRPVLLISFALDFLLWGLNGFGYHLTSIILHMLNAVLIYFLIQIVFNKKLVSFLTSFLFIIHPINTEAIAYASGRTDPLFVLFALLSIILFAKIHTSSCKSGAYSQRKKAIVFSFSLFFFLLSLLSKESGIVIPFLLLPVFYALKKQKRSSFKTNTLSSLFPFFLIVVIYIILRLTVLNFANTLNFYTEENIYTKSVLVRFYTFTFSFFEYLKMLIFPNTLSIARKPQFLTNFLNRYTLSFVFFILASLIYFIKVKFNAVSGATSFHSGTCPKEKTPQKANLENYSSYRLKGWTFFSSEDKQSIFAFSFLWFFISIAPSSGIIPINNVIAEHYLYFPSIGFFFLISSLISYLLNRFKFSKTKIMISLLIALYSGFLISKTLLRNFEYRDAITFYTISLVQSPWYVPIRNNLAMTYSEQGEYDLAIFHYQKAIETKDSHPNTHHNLANTYKAIGRYREAEEEYYKALKIDPSFYFSYYGLADLYEKIGEKEKLEQIRSKIKE